ncbi:crossover junction endonuclease MUS81 [Pieris rapae]|uniref:crossover junction endonuclease MUS81 n=1 Tax=Pieris rapae TaxID=64459 RepID=UPI001E27A78D|nr:crossover junction endonuclease MUS81 [Pieris rapae]
MNPVAGKRLTYKRMRPNPLFEVCLEKIYEEARLNNTKYLPVIKEAMLSLSKYPLPLKSGADCAILKGFNKSLCVLLDKYVLEEVSKNCLSHNTTTDEVIDLETYQGSVSKDFTLKPLSTQEIIDVENCNTSIIHHKDNIDNSPRSSCSEILPKKGIYKPQFKSGAFAILMGLLEHYKKNSEKNLSKNEIIQVAQKYCEESFKVAKSVRYSAWSSMARLINKGLVIKIRSKKIQYALTEKGVSMAYNLWNEYETKPSTNKFMFQKPMEVVDIGNVSSSDNLINLQEINPFEKINTDCEEALTPVIYLPANCYDIVLLIDKNEKNGNDDPFHNYPDLKYELRSLKVGDFTWIARNRVSNEELVLPYIIERKRMDDLGASIKDGRFHEQKFRLRKCGLKHVFYLVESYDKNKHVGLPLPSLMQALANTRIQDGFKIYYTDSLIKSHRFLAMMTKRLQVEYMNKSLCGASCDPKDGMLMTYNYFNKSSVKTKVLSVTEMFIKMLLQLKGMSVEKALAITSVYKTPKSLLTAYENCDTKLGALLLAHLKYGDLNRNVGPTVSKTIYQLFTTY